MLKGRTVTLRPVLESDLDLFYEGLLDIENRGDYFPRSVSSQAVVKKRFAETGFWEKEEGTLLICDQAGQMLRHRVERRRPAEAEQVTYPPVEPVDLFHDGVEMLLGGGRFGMAPHQLRGGPEARQRVAEPVRHGIGVARH